MPNALDFTVGYIQYDFTHFGTVASMYVTERSHRWLRDVRLGGGFELRCCLALSYLY